MTICFLSRALPTFLWHDPDPAARNTCGTYTDSTRDDTIEVRALMHGSAGAEVIITPDEYVRSIVNRYALPTGLDSPGGQAGERIYPLIAEWGDAYLLEALLAGSYAKGTSVRGSADVDIFISLASNTPGTLRDIYESLVRFLRAKGIPATPRNVAVRVTYAGRLVDLVPARKQSGNTRDHSLYRRRADSWTQTNIHTQIRHVGNSGRLDEIRAVKIWRDLHGLEFPSFMLELAVIHALSGQPRNQPADNVLRSLRFIAERLPTTQLVDPANSNNVVSDDLTQAEKQTLVASSRTSVIQPGWGQIIW